MGFIRSGRQRKGLWKLNRSMSKVQSSALVINHHCQNHIRLPAVDDIFFLSGFLKNHDYEIRPQSTAELKLAITTKINL